MKKLLCLAWGLNIISGIWLIYPHKIFMTTHHEIALVTYAETLFIAFVLSVMNQKTD